MIKKVKDILSSNRNETTLFNVHFVWETSVIWTSRHRATSIVLPHPVKRARPSFSHCRRSGFQKCRGAPSARDWPFVRGTCAFSSVLVHLRRPRKFLFHRLMYTGCHRSSPFIVRKSSKEEILYAYVNQEAQYSICRHVKTIVRRMRNAMEAAAS